MKQEVLNIRVLVADEGFALTEADNSIDPQERTYAHKIYLSAQDDPENYIEVPYQTQEESPDLMDSIFGQESTSDPESDPESVQPSETE